MTTKLIAVDLDGTLLNSKQQITPKTREALQKANDMGITVVPCSGRPFPGVKEYLDELGLTGKKQYAVTFNGALVFNLEGDEIVKELLDYPDFVELEKIGRQYDVSFHYELEDRFVTLERMLNYFLSRESWLTRMPIEIKDFDEIPKDLSFTKGMFSGTPEKMVELQKELPEYLFKKYNVATSDPTLLEFNKNTASKGNALIKLAQVLDINQSEVMIFGDQRNDISMFNVPAFKKIAMGNAIPEIKERANFVTKTNDEDGIAYALEQLVF